MQQHSNDHEWANRRKLGIPTGKGLLVLTCMDERIPLGKALGIELGDAHVLRNAGGVVTEDVLRSAALTTNLLGTSKIMVVLHTDCGQLLRPGDEMAALLDEKLRERGSSLEEAEIDPLPELRLEDGAHGKWMRAFDDLDAAARRQVEILRASPLIPDDVKISGHVYDVGTGELRTVVG
jgi:carbonic anhydrase